MQYDLTVAYADCYGAARLLLLRWNSYADHYAADGGKMDMSTSTVSRAIQNKYIQYRGRIVPLRSFFTTAIRSDASVSSQAVRQRIQDLIKTENPEAPLSDESVRIALSALGIEVSRRAVAKYRMALDIPPSSQRKKR